MSLRDGIARRTEVEWTHPGMQDPAVDFTVVTPSFRQLDWLAGCISSIADQEGVTMEHIVQDGGTEGFEEFSRAMARRWPDRPGYRRIMVSEPDRGMYDAINRGLRRATGVLCSYLNCDEQYLPATLRRVREAALDDRRHNLWVGDVLVVDAAGQALCQRKVLPPTLRHTWTCHLAAFTAATFFRRIPVAENFPFDPAYRAAADGDWFVRVLRSGQRVSRLGFACSTFMEMGDNLGLSPVALEERRRLNGTAPRWMRALSYGWVLEHRVRRWFGGCHRVSDVRYEIYMPGAAERKGFWAPRLRTSWPGRLWQK